MLLERSVTLAHDFEKLPYHNFFGLYLRN